MRRNRDPGTRNPLSCPESKQRMIVCWLTLQILAASPVVNTVFMVGYVPLCRPRSRPGRSPPADPSLRSQREGAPTAWPSSLIGPVSTPDAPGPSRKPPTSVDRPLHSHQPAYSAEANEIAEITNATNYNRWRNPVNPDGELC